MAAVFAMAWGMVFLTGTQLGISGNWKKELAVSGAVESYLVILSQSRRLPPLQVVSNSKFVSVGVGSPTEINAPRGCAVILIGICQLC